MNRSTGDDGLRLIDTTASHLRSVCEMERHEETLPYILATSREKHVKQLRDRDFIYKSIVAADDVIAGFIILKLDPDGRSVELARIVVERKGLAYGTRAMALVERLSRDQLRRTRIWLDVFESNHRARRVYDKCGYVQFDRTMLEGRPLLLLEKEI